jgi:hypothetical protein
MWSDFGSKQTMKSVLVIVELIFVVIEYIATCKVNMLDRSKG